MAARATPRASPRTDLADDARRQLYVVLGRAKAAGPLVSLTASRYWSETLQLMEGRTIATKVEMIRRTSALLDLLADRATWPR